MINEENLNKMYNGLIEDKKFTTKELNGYGFNSKDLMDLINDGVLERVRRGYYSFLSIDSLFYYGKQLIALKEYDKATLCFLKCFELNPNHGGACFQLFLRSIQDKNYEKAFEYFEHFYDSENKYYNNDSNFYLYLLSMITEIPEKHREYAKYLKLEDIKIDFNDKRFEDPYAQNKVRISSLNQRFTLAFKQLNELIKQQEKLSVQDIIVKTLLSQTIEVQNNLKKNVAYLAVEKKYDEIISCLEEVQKRHHLSVADECILFLAKEISRFKKTGIIPEKEIVSTNKLFEAINGKNFELALSLSQEYIERNNIDPNDNAMFVLLKDITGLIKEKTNKLNEKPVIEPTENSTMQEKFSNTNTVPITSNITFATVIEYLTQQDFDNSFRSLRGYLNNINKSEYEFLIIDLIKISLMEKDMAFSKPMIALTYISRECFTFDISEYIQNFYETLAQNRFIEARIYLDIIVNSNKLGQTCVLTDGLKQILNNTEKMLDYKENNEVLDRLDASIKIVKQESQNQQPLEIEKTVQQSITTPIYSDGETVNDKENQVMETINIQTTKKEILKPAGTDYDDSGFINSKLEELYEKGIILLKPMDDSRRKEIHNIVKYIPNVVSFSVGSDSNRQVVLRYKPYIDEYVDYPAIAKEGNSAYSNGEYYNCIKLYRTLLEFGEPKAWVYAKLGLAYMKKFDINIAIDYLTVATELSKTEDKRYDFEELIEKLKGKRGTANNNKEDVKPFVKIKESDFMEEDGYYGIKNFEEIAYLVFHDGIDINSACLIFLLNNEQINIVKLIFAREYYSQKNYEFGDKLLKIVEKSNNKTSFVINLLNEIRRNKRFYYCRNHDKENKLVLSLKKNILT